VVLDFLRKDNALQGWSERPDAANIDASFVDDAASALENMPSQVLRHFIDHAVGVFLVRNLGGTAYSDLLNNHGANKRGFIVLDVGSLARTANEWATWRERSPFADHGEAELVATIEPSQSNDCSKAIQYVLLRETGHLVGALQEHHGSWRENDNPTAFPFSALSWKRANGKTASNADDRFTTRAAVHFYKFDASKLTSRDIEPVYRELVNGDFRLALRSDESVRRLRGILCDVRPCRASRQALERSALESGSSDHGRGSPDSREAVPTQEAILRSTL